MHIIKHHSFVKHLSLQEKLKLAREVEDLNNTVFSKSFKAPSAWAEREVKYKMEKRDWDAESKKLREAITKLEAENARYRADNKAEEFETQIQVPSIHQRGIEPPMSGTCGAFHLPSVVLEASMFLMLCFTLYSSVFCGLWWILMADCACTSC